MVGCVDVTELLLCELSQTLGLTVSVASSRTTSFLAFIFASATFTADA